MAGSLFYLVSFLKKELKGTGTMWKRYAEIFSGAAVFFFFMRLAKKPRMLSHCVTDMILCQQTGWDFGQYVK